MTQISVRVDEETKEKFNQIVESYKAEIVIGKISNADVLSNLIANYHAQLVRKGKIKVEQ